MSDRDTDEAENRAGPSERWVCGACGKHTELGGHRYDLGDTSCVIHAVLCEGEKRDGRWSAVPFEPEVVE